jgi:murein DD-endopeptidase MepM/ murein hydrolase activator NlpD
MKIIILPGSRRKGVSLAIGPLGGTLLAAVLLAVVSGSFYGGLHYATVHSDTVGDRLRREVGSVWERELERQQREVERTRLEARNSLDAMAGRLSILQGHVLRLDALGSRLASKAGLDMGFGEAGSPGMGGPEPTAAQESLGARDFLADLIELERELQDKADKLSALESIMLERSLSEQTQPEGTPVADFWQSSAFGFRTDPITGKREFHSGVDYAGPSGSPITAVAAGIVTWSGPRFGYGNMVEISHGNGILTRYGHNSRNLVGIGDKVEKGEIIALMGSSGRTTGTHVHFEVVRNGEFLNPRGRMNL